MDFRRVALTGEDARLRDEIRAVLAEHLTDEVRAEVRRTMCKFNEPLCLALGERGWILPDRPPELGGAGLTPFQCELLRLELDRSDAPLEPLGTTKLILLALEESGPAELVQDITPEVAAGRVRMALGYTEPDHGSDIAAAETRAERDGDDWIVNGVKKFTTHAQFCQYTFLLTRTDPNVAKHKGLTMFLLPLDSEGVEIRPILTVGDERTNYVHYTNVRVSDRYRLGGVNEGWKTLLGPLNAEHGDREGARQLGPPAMTGRLSLRTFQNAFEHAVAWAKTPGGDGSAPIEDPIVRDRLARVGVKLEAAANSPDPFARVYAANTCIRECAELVTLVGPGAVVSRDEPTAIENGAMEFAHRFAQGTSIYGGTVEVFKNIIAQHVLGLPRALPPAA
jgi:alkylation response protein AidB-like acyl-CoA dehydrogenase